MAQFLLATLLLLLPTVCHTELSNKCKKTNKLFPNKVYDRPTRVGSSAVCSMFDESCCSLVTEYYMKVETSNFTDVVFSRVNMGLKKVNDIIEDNSLTPIIFSEEFNNLVKDGGDEEKLAVAALSYYIHGICVTNGDEAYFDLIKTNTASIKMLGDHLSALYKGLDAIKHSLKVISEYKISEACEMALMMNGIAPNKELKSTMCQICIKDTAIIRTCANTCKNTVRGCVNDLSEVSYQLTILAETLDQVNKYLLRQLYETRGALNSIEISIETSFSKSKTFKTQCSSGKPNTFVKTNFTGQLGSFSAGPLQLVNIMERTMEYLCTFSRSNENCWTKVGMTPSDTSYVPNYSTTAQLLNPVLPKAAVYDTVIDETVEMLRGAIRVAKEVIATQEVEEPTDEGGDDDMAGTTGAGSDEGEDSYDIGNEGDAGSTNNGEGSDNPDGDDASDGENDVEDSKEDVDGNDVEGASTAGKDNSSTTTKHTVAIILTLILITVI